MFAVLHTSPEDKLKKKQKDNVLVNFHISFLSHSFKTMSIFFLKKIHSFYMNLFC